MAKRKYTKKEVRDLNIVNQVYWYAESRAEKLGISVDTLLFHLLSGNAKRMTEEYFHNNIKFSKIK